MSLEDLSPEAQEVIRALGVIEQQRDDAQRKAQGWKHRFEKYGRHLDGCDGELHGGIIVKCQCGFVSENLYASKRFIPSA